jgi:hypothetical protein
VNSFPEQASGRAYFGTNHVPALQSVTRRALTGIKRYSARHEQYALVGLDGGGTGYDIARSLTEWLNTGMI